MECEKLTEIQRNIIDIVGNEDIAVFAVAGSGKTSVLVCSYLKILDQIKLPIEEAVSKILVITFTDDAATEIRERIRKALFERYGYVGPLTNISTIHSFANDILQHFSIQYGIDPGYTIGEDYLIAGLMNTQYEKSKRILSQEEIDLLDENIGILEQGEWNLKTIIYTIYWKIKSTGWSFEETLEKIRGIKQKFKDSILGDKIVEALIKILRNFYENLEREKKIIGKLSYDDILYYALEILENNKEAMDIYSRKYEFIIVDEFQDTSIIQQKIIEKISNKNRRIIAGDYFQSIYEWRDATPVSAIDFIKRNEFKIIKMDENFRSIPSILNVVNTLFSNLFKKNIKDIEYINMKTSESELENAGLFVLTVKKGSIKEMRIEEAEKIAKTILYLVKNYKIKEKNGELRPIKYGDIAILFRKRTGMNIYAKALQKYGIRYSFIERSAFFESEEISVIMNVLISLRDGTWEDIHNGNNFEILKYVYNISYNEFLNDNSEKIRDFKNHMKILSNIKDSRKDKLILKFLRLTNYDINSLKKTDGIQRYLNIYKLVDIARKEEENRILSLKEFLEELDEMRKNENVSSIPIYDPLDDSVRLMTIHSSKGLEFPVVFVADLFSMLNYTDRDIIIDRDIGIYLNIEELVDENAMKKIIEKSKEKENRENIRILYVAFTRAKQYLILGLPENKSTNESSSSIPENKSLNESFSSIIMEYLGEENISKYREKFFPLSELKIEKINNYENGEIVVSIPKVAKIEPIFLSVSDVTNYYFCPFYFEISKMKIFKHTNYGILFHEFMENIDFEETKEGNFDEILKKFLNTKIGELIRKNMENIKREYPFHVRYKEIILRGRIDLLIVSDEIILLDYKTGEEKLTDKIQLQVYSYAIKKIFGKLPTCYIYYTRNDKLDQINVKDQDLLILENILDEMINSIRDRSFDKKINNCDQCDMKQVCKSLEKQN
ncbi:MAG: UvrD-helicase domain-containing protein [Thermoplasmata archaeon]